jgi:hypothetical protein
MILSMEGFTFASALDLNMGYYHIKLDADAQKLCTIVFPWRMKHKNTNAYPWVSRLPDSCCFKNVRSKLVQDIEYVKTSKLS